MTAHIPTPSTPKITRVLAAGHTDLTARFLRRFCVLVNEAAGNECHDDSPFVYRVDTVIGPGIGRQSVVVEAQSSNDPDRFGYATIDFLDRLRFIDDSTLGAIACKAVSDARIHCGATITPKRADFDPEIANVTPDAPFANLRSWEEEECETDTNPTTPPGTSSSPAD